MLTPFGERLRASLHGKVVKRLFFGNARPVRTELCYSSQGISGLVSLGGQSKSKASHQQVEPLVDSASTSVPGPKESHFKILNTKLWLALQGTPSEVVDVT